MKAPTDCKRQLAEGKSLCQTRTWFKAIFHWFSPGSWLYVILASHTWPHTDIRHIFSIWTLGFSYRSSSPFKDLLGSDSFLTHNGFSKCQQFLWLTRQVKIFLAQDKIRSETSNMHLCEWIIPSYFFKGPGEHNVLAAFPFFCHILVLISSTTQIWFLFWILPKLPASQLKMFT